MRRSILCLLFSIAVLLSFLGCRHSQPAADLLLTNGTVLTLDDAGNVGVKARTNAIVEAYASGAREQPNKMKQKMDMLSADDVKALASLPSREQLLAQLAGALQAPPAGLEVDVDRVFISKITVDGGPSLRRAASCFSGCRTT